MGKQNPIIYNLFGKFLNLTSNFFAAHHTRWDCVTSVQQASAIDCRQRPPEGTRRFAFTRRTLNIVARHEICAV